MHASRDLDLHNWLYALHRLGCQRQNYRWYVLLGSSDPQTIWQRFDGILGVNVSGSYICGGVSATQGPKLGVCHCDHQWLAVERWNYGCWTTFLYDGRDGTMVWHQRAMVLDLGLVSHASIRYRVYLGKPYLGSSINIG